MGLIKKTISVAAATALATMTVGAGAAPFDHLSDAVAQIGAEASPQAEPVQYRQYRHYGPGGPQAWHYGPPHPGHGGRDDTGAAIALGIFGLMLGGMLASQAQRQDAINYCAQRFRSYDPYTMTYLGYDGLRHPCP